MNLLVEVRFTGLSYRQTLKAYDLATTVFSAEIADLSPGYRKLEVFFSKFRLVLWVKLGPKDEFPAQGKEQLIRAVTVLLQRLKTGLPKVWAEVSGLVVLLGNELLPVALDSLQAGKETLAPGRIHVQDTQHYWREMTRYKVLIDNGQREKAIRQLLAAGAAAAGGQVISSRIMNEVVVATETPVLKTLEIKAEYMDLPQELLTLILENSLCFGVQSPEGKFLGQALYIGNGEEQGPDLNGSLAEAKQTLEADLSLTWEERMELLAQKCYLSGLGSYLDKQRRLQKIVLTIADQIDAGNNVCTLAQQASELAKVDLTSGICQLYPKFRGHMGGIIAQREGMPQMVAAAIVEHWQPSEYSQKLPHTLVGALLGIADRLDDICGHYYQSEFKLSHYRCVKTWFDEIIAIVDSVALDVSMTRLLKFSLSLYESQGLVPWREKDLAHLLKVFADRLYYYLLGQDYSEGVANALTVVQPDNVFCSLQKAAVMAKPDNHKDLETCAEACKLLERTCAREYTYDQAAREFLEEPEEKDLFEVYLVAKDDIEDSLEARNFSDALARLAKLKTPLLRFINSVDLDTDDKPVQYNRLSLLAEIRELYHSFADFSML